MTQLKPISNAGWLKDVNDNFAALGSIGTQDGVGSLRVARFTFDTADEANRPIGAHKTGVKIPAGAVIVDGFMVVDTAFTSASTNTGTIAIHVKAANDLQTAAPVSGAPYSTTGNKVLVPDIETIGDYISLTAEGEITCTVAVAALTAGKLHGYVYFVE